jgi:cytochrome oxidase assembly protein ShyY1
VVAPRQRAGTVVGLMYRFLLRPRWIAFTLVMALLVVVMVNLGLWQLRRLGERRDLNREIAARAAQEAAPLDEVLTDGTVPADVQWRRVLATGTYDADAQVLIRDRSQGGAAGVFVVTPLRLDDGRFLAVARGFVPAGTAIPGPPPGEVTVEGRLRVSQRRNHSWEKADPSEGVLDTLNRVDVPRLDQQVAGDAVPMYVEAIASTPADPGVAPIAEPERGDGPHLSYAGQWFLFSALTVVAYVVAVRHSARTRQQRRSAAALDLGDAAEQLHDVR